MEKERREEKEKEQKQNKQDNFNHEYPERIECSEVNLEMRIGISIRWILLIYVDTITIFENKIKIITLTL